MAYEEDDLEKSGSWLISFLLGALLGAAATLLLAPKAGRQTREQLRDMAKDAKGKAEGYYDQVKGKVTTAMHREKDTSRDSSAE
jgi:gas vesicle protein